MKICYINVLNNRSTGTIAKEIGLLSESQLNAETFYIWRTFYGKQQLQNEFVIENNNFFYKVYYHLIGKKINNGFLGDGFNSFFKTFKIVRILKKIKPDIVHLHNIHGDYCNLNILFSFFKKTNIKVVYTIHDCWLVTGCCPHFTLSGCKKYKDTECSGGCSYINMYPLQTRDIAHKVLTKKKKLFSSVNNLWLVTCSNYIEKIIRDSYLKTHHILTIKNGIDLMIFSNIKRNDEKILSFYSIPTGCKYFLAISDYWSRRKGDFIISKVSEMLLEFNIILVIVGKKYSFTKLSNNIVIEEINSKNDLACLYRNSIAFLDPTLEDNYPTVLLEACACGTPSVSFDTGGCKEIITKETGFIVEYNNVPAFLATTKKILFDSKFDRKACRKHALQIADKRSAYASYLNLYLSILKS